MIYIQEVQALCPALKSSPQNLKRIINMSKMGWPKLFKVDSTAVGNL